MHNEHEEETERMRREYEREIKDTINLSERNTGKFFKRHTHLQDFPLIRKGSTIICRGPMAALIFMSR